MLVHSPHPPPPSPYHPFSLSLSFLPFSFPLLSPLTEPPSRPRDVQITAAGPQIITVTWDEPEIKNGATSLTYTVVCTRVSTGTVDVNSTGVQNTEITFFTLLPNTMYSCSVVAFNNFGGSVPAMAQITTPARNSESLLPVYMYCHCM